MAPCVFNAEIEKSYFATVVWVNFETDAFIVQIARKLRLNQNNILHIWAISTNLSFPNSKRLEAAIVGILTSG